MKIDKSMFGDMAIKDLSPKDANSGGRIIKNLRICGSGLYTYHVSEAPLMGLTIPEDYTGDTFKIFRSPQVLEENKDLYARVPIITGHHVRVNTSNAKQLAVGLVGDSVQSEVGEDGETYLYTTGTIITGDGIRAYEELGELSVGYDPVVEWMPGDYKGEAYQAVLKGFNEINHLLICKTARGGHQCMIMDELPQILDSKAKEPKNNGGKRMGIFKKIFGAPSKKMTGDAAVVSALLQSIKVGADAKTQVSHVKDMIGDSADETLKGYFEDLMGDEVAQASKEDLSKAIDVVDNYCKKLLGDEAADKPAEDKPADQKPEDKPAEDKPADDKTKEGGDEPPQKKTEEEFKKPSNGDAIDYERIINGVAEKMAAAKQPKKEELPGDELEVSKLSALLAGDEKQDSVTSTTVMKEIWG